MSRIEDLGSETAVDVAEHTRALKHDLGKYVALQIRWLGADASEDEVCQALRSDLLGTRRSPAGTLDAVEVWEGLRGPLLGEVPLPCGDVVDLSLDPDIRALMASMDIVRSVLCALRSTTLEGDGLQRGVAAAREVSAACRRLAKRARAKAE